MFYIIDKVKGDSSFQAIRRLARELKVKRAGHTGTLDPLATGLLLVAFGNDTRLIEYADQGNKTYVAEMRCGFTADTLDITGEVRPVTNAKIPDLAFVTAALKSLVGSHEQTPPAFSAKKVDGKPAYSYARQGISVKLKTQNITVYAIDEIEQIDHDTFRFRTVVSRGTYIRSLIDGAGQKMGCGAIMTNLRRTKIGDLDESLVGKPLSAHQVISLPTITLSGINDHERFFNGAAQSTNLTDGLYAVTDGKAVIAIVKVQTAMLKVHKLLAKDKPE